MEEGFAQELAVLTQKCQFLSIVEMSWRGIGAVLRDISAASAVFRDRRHWSLPLCLFCADVSGVSSRREPPMGDFSRILRSSVRMMCGVDMEGGSGL